MKQRVFFFELLRCVAAVAVIAIHVLAPYRDGLEKIPLDQWLTAVTVNAMSRWAVPVFILMTGALLLSDTRPFNAASYAKKRLGKVLVPFVVWSIFYAWLSGWTAQGFDGGEIRRVLSDAGTHATYYHLYFFYYFIPLYLLAPLFRKAIVKWENGFLVAYLSLWGITTLLFLKGIDGVWSNQYWLYSGYLPLGYLLYRRVPLTPRAVSVAVLLGGLALGVTLWAVITGSMDAGAYKTVRWFSYKTLNTVLVASMVFMVGRYTGEGIPQWARAWVGIVGRYSLGIYILHPLFLWPMKAYGWHEGHHPAWVIPFWVAVSGSLALGASWLVARSPKTRWLLP